MIFNYPFKSYRESSGMRVPAFHSVEIEYMELLYALCWEYRFNSILEIGTATGHSTWWWDRYAGLREDVNVHIVSVDPLPQKEAMLPKLWKSPLVSFVELPSDEFFAQQDQKFEFVFIDGDHNYDQAKRDMYHALELNSAKVIAIHDTVYHWETVGRMIGEFQTIGEWSHYSQGKGLSIVRFQNS